MAVVAEFHARAVAAGNVWAQRLALKTTFGLVPGAPSGMENAVEDVAVGGRVVERLVEWEPRVGEEVLLQGFGLQLRRVSVTRLDGRFALVAADGVGEWALVSDLRPLRGTV